LYEGELREGKRQARAGTMPAVGVTQIGGAI
jgi:hypothetical protein